MKALNIRLEDSKFLLEDIPRPQIGKNPYSPDDVIVKVEYCGICGTELMLYRNGFPKGVLKQEKIGMGHEFSGTVVETGSHVKTIKPGDRVVGEVTTSPCGKCSFCQEGKNNFCRDAGAYMLHQGAYSKYLPIPSRNLHVLDKEVSLKAGALSQPLSLAVNALKVVGVLQPFESIVIMGPGPIGLLMVVLARSYGAGPIIVTGRNKDTKRLHLARELGADAVFNIDKDDPGSMVKEMTGGLGADIVVEIAGSADAVSDSFNLVRDCGRIVLTGAGYPPLQVDLAGQVMMRQLAVLGCRGDPTPCWIESVRLLGSGKINIEPIISHVLPLEKWEEGFQLSMSGEALKVLLQP
jgi:L-iditol 2-dehydrogenase